jgi:hypothetical protein
MCEHCGKSQVVWLPKLINDLDIAQIKQNFRGVFPAASEDSIDTLTAQVTLFIEFADSQCFWQSDDGEACQESAMCNVVEMEIGGHNCDRHRGYNIEHIGMAVDKFLPIQATEPYNCDGIWSGNNCDQRAKWARVEVAVTSFCDQHASAMGLPHDPELRSDAMHPPQN